ncbi:hypothetical protein [Rugosimonospora acidiphila]
MAILLDFEKVRDDGREVEYVFGYPELNRRLVILKDSQQGRALDGNEDRDYAAVLVKLLRIRRSRGTWPVKGSYAA